MSSEDIKEEIPVRYIKDSVVYVFRGDIDTELASDMEEKFITEISRGNNIVFDLSSVKYVNSRFVSILVGLFRNTAEAGKELIILRPSQFVYETLYNMGLFNKVRAFISEEALVEHLESPEGRK
ncbi:MAG: STAS domain-containing protein [Fibrobacterota bacterium]